MMAMALILASAIAVFCVPFDDPSDAAADYMSVSDSQGPVPAPIPDRHMASQYDGCAPPQKPSFDAAEPERPYATDGPKESPRYVIDMPGRSDDRPERIIEDYGRAYEEKRILEEQGAEVFIYDPGLMEHPDDILFKAIGSVFGGMLTSERPAGAEIVTPDRLPETHSQTFLELLSEQVGKDSWLGQMISVMMSQYVISSNESEGVASSQGREDDIPEVPADIIAGDGDDDEPDFFVYDEVEHTPSSEVFLVEHGFDSGTFF